MSCTDSRRPHLCSTLLTLPPELIDRICIEISDFPDLLSLGLTCKLLAGVVFPNHPLYHTIQAPLSCDHLWNHLIQNPLFCGYIRRLEVRDSKIRIPRLDNNDAAFTSPLYRKDSSMGEKFWSYELFTRALLLMTNLRSFLWEHLEIPALLTSGGLWNELIFKNEQGKVEKDFPMGKILEKIQHSNHNYYVPLFETPVRYNSSP